MKEAFLGRVVWITGASSGIGEGLARVFREEGARLVLSARRVGRLEALAKELGGPEHARVLPLDLSELAALSDKAISAKNLFGRVDVLVNNAGIGQRSPAAETPHGNARRLIDVNVLGPVALTREVLPEMLDRESGHLVFVSSVLGHLGLPGRSLYAASKHALRGYADSVRAEVHGRGVRVTVASPGFVRTEISLHALEKSGKPHGVMDPGQGRGMDPLRCAREIVRAARKGRREVYPGGLETWAPLLQRLAPGLMARLLRRIRAG
jgi:short-subunit dehydrogenase